jgi:Fe2+ transport system protein B
MVGSSGAYLPDMSQFNSENINTYVDQIKDNNKLQTSMLDELEQKNKILLEKQLIQKNQLKEIEEKEKLLLTRSRMLQISQDRNSYKKKIIYSLIALIFGIFILTLVMYVLFIRKAKSAEGSFLNKRLI